MNSNLYDDLAKLPEEDQLYIYRKMLTHIENDANHGDKTSELYIDYIISCIKKERIKWISQLVSVYEWQICK